MDGARTVQTVFSQRNHIISSIKAHETSESRTELDLHADTCVMGTAFHIYETTGMTCTVHAYSADYASKIISIAQGGTAFDHRNGITFILDFNNCLDMSKSQDPSLLNLSKLVSWPCCR